MTEDEKIKLRELYAQMAERNKKEYEWFKNSIIVLGTVFGLIISLKTERSKDFFEHLIFGIMITINALCILCGLIYLYADSDTVHRLVHQLEKNIQSGYSGIKKVEVDQKPIYGVLRVLYFYLLILSIVSLIVYSIFADK